MPFEPVTKRTKAEVETVERIPDLKIIKPKVFPDDRGYFVERFNSAEFAEELNFKEEFKQARAYFFTKF
ncbi:hypothetical protein COOONC_11393 [Cooperia oncophora]